MTISRKLLVGSLAVSVISVLLTALITATIGFNIAEGVVEKETEKMLVSQRETQKEFIHSYLMTIEHELKAFAGSHSADSQLYP